MEIVLLFNLTGSEKTYYLSVWIWSSFIRTLIVNVFENCMDTQQRIISLDEEGIRIEWWRHQNLKLLWHEKPIPDPIVDVTDDRCINVPEISKIKNDWHFWTKADIVLQNLINKSVFNPLKFLYYIIPKHSVDCRKRIFCLILH